MKDKESLLKNIFLTFDDGPNEPYTTQILDILKGFQVKASFFVCGKNVERYPQVTKRIVEEGHAIGNHTYSHSRILNFFGFLAKEVERTNEIIQKITGVRTNFFRPPWGFITPWFKKNLKANKYKIILWDISANDWKKTSARNIEEKILKRVKPNSIILLHDGRETHSLCDRSQTILALPSLIKKIKERGYVFRELRE